MAPAAWHRRLHHPGSDLFLPGHRPIAEEQLQRPAHQRTDGQPWLEVRPPPRQQGVGPGLLEPVFLGIATFSTAPITPLLEELKKWLIRELCNIF